MSEREPSGPSQPSPSSGAGLFDGVVARGPVREATSDHAWLQAMLDVEAALARAQARAGLFPGALAEEITRACRAERFDITALGRAAAETGNPVPALVRALTALVAEPAAGQVHRGATSQDVMDTAAMLVVQRALAPLLDDLRSAADAAAALATRYRTTLMAGRTLLQQALPITFGLKAAGWMSGLDDAAARLEAIRGTRLAVQLGGAAGTLASLGDAGPTVVDYLAGELDLAAPIVPWHAARGRIAELAAALGVAAGALAKAARDVTLLAQTEVGEVREGGPAGTSGGGGAVSAAYGGGAVSAAYGGGAVSAAYGGSSTLPHKRNPIAAVSVVACAARAPGLVATLMATMAQEHERAAGAWHAEWRPLNDLLVTVGSAAAWLRECLTHLQVDETRMHVNLAATGGLLLAERVTAALAPHLGRLAAHDLVTEACADAIASGRPLAATLGARPAVAAWLSPLAIEGLLDPSGYLGSADLFVARALQAHDSTRRGDASRRRTTNAPIAVHHEVVHHEVVHHEIVGPPGAPALVLSGSLGSTLGMWAPQIEALARHFRVVRYDLRGHGRSPVPPGPYDIADLGADLVALLDRLGLARAHLCGLSLGGMVSLWTAAHHPERVDRLVVCCTSAQLGPPTAWAQRVALVNAGGMAAVADTVVGRWLTPAFSARAPAIADGLRAMIAGTPAAGYVACCGAIERMDLRADLGAIRAATLAIAAADDPSTPPAHLSGIAERIAGCRLVVIDDAAHLVNVEQPERTTDLILAHLQGAPSSPP